MPWLFLVTSKASPPTLSITWSMQLFENFGILVFPTCSIWFRNDVFNLTIGSLCCCWPKYINPFIRSPIPKTILVGVDLTYLISCEFFLKNIFNWFSYTFYKLLQKLQNNICVHHFVEGFLALLEIGAKGSIVWEGYILVTSKQTRILIFNPQIVPKSTTFYPMSFVQRTLVTFISGSNCIIFISGISHAWSNSMWWPNQRGPSQKEKKLSFACTHNTLY
jgi:hypothetical protein